MRKRMIFLWVLMAGLLLAAVPAWAGEKCYTCHTMHASQGGVLMGDGPHPLLVINDCVGCHTGTNTGSIHWYVLSTADPSATMLAGGNFYWVAQGVANYAMGHNVAGISPADSARFSVAPGGTFSAATPMKCSGTRGCHGDRDEADEWKAMRKTHHNNGLGQRTAPATVGAAYRFLKGIEGYEDTDAEFTRSPSDHNEYKGVDKATDNQAVTNTISSLCGQCHGDFHHGSMSVGGNMRSPWLHQPTDLDLSNLRDGNHPDYDGMSSTYSNTVPVGRATIPASPGNTLFSVADDAIVTCISCHRAHGSPYSSILRWDYRGWPASGTSGCSYCHTTKD